MEPLSAEVERLLNNSMAPQSWRTYDNAEKSFCNFRFQYNLPNIWPVPHYDLINFIAHLSVSGQSPSTVSTYVSAISYLHKIRGMSDPTKLFIIGKMIEGLKRKKSKTDARSPITLNLLHQLIPALSSVCSSQYESVMFKAAFSLAFHAFLRVGEFTAASKSDTSGRALKISDITFSNTNENLTLRIRESKTDQRGYTSTLFLTSMRNKNMCPVSSLKSYVSMRPTQSNSQLFIHYNGSPLTRYQFCSVLKKSLIFCKVNTGCYRSHSFRIGAATESANKGVPNDKIKLWGRWKSNAYTRYIRIPDIHFSN